MEDARDERDVPARESTRAEAVNDCAEPFLCDHEDDRLTTTNVTSSELPRPLVRQDVIIDMSYHKVCAINAVGLVALTNGSTMPVGARCLAYDSDSTAKPRSPTSVLVYKRSLFLKPWQCNFNRREDLKL